MAHRPAQRRIRNLVRRQRRDQAEAAALAPLVAAVLAAVDAEEYDALAEQLGRLSAKTRKRIERAVGRPLTPPEPEGTP